MNQIKMDTTVDMDFSGNFNCHHCATLIKSTRNNTQMVQSGKTVLVWVDCPECGTSHQFEGYLEFTQSSDMT